MNKFQQRRAYLMNENIVSLTEPQVAIVERIRSSQLGTFAEARNKDSFFRFSLCNKVWHEEKHPAIGSKVALTDLIKRPYGHKATHAINYHG